MNFSLNMHNVTEIILGPVKENTSYDTYATRTIEIKTKEGDFEITLFSPHVDKDDESELLKVSA
jgi:hypothetical protein